MLSMLRREARRLQRQWSDIQDRMRRRVQFRIHRTNQSKRLHTRRETFTGVPPRIRKEPLMEALHEYSPRRTKEIPDDHSRQSKKRCYKATDTWSCSNAEDTIGKTNEEQEWMEDDENSKDTNQQWKLMWRQTSNSLTEKRQIMWRNMADEDKA